MRLKNYNIKSLKSEEKTNKKSRITYEERITIEYLYKKGYGPTKIGNEIGRDKSVVSREIKRNKEVKYSEVKGININIYRACVAQGKYKYNKRKAGRKSSVEKDNILKTFIETKIKENKWSPEEIAGYIKKNKMQFKIRPSFQAIYYWIEKKQLNINKFDLTHKYKSKNKKKRISTEQSLSRKHKSIHLRPEIIDKNEEFGHWELDCVEGNKKTNTTYMTLLERKTKKYIVIPMKNHTSNSIKETIDKLEKKYKSKFNKIFKSMTTDNGHEFINYEKIEKSIYNKEKRVEVYYTDPYSSWQKGMNENCNGILRRFIPKGSDLGKISEFKLETILYKINNKPRKILGFEAADYLFKKELNDILNIT